MVDEIEEQEVEISKYTLEAVYNGQESIRQHLDMIIEENRPITGKIERDQFFRELTYSTLGLGNSEEVTIRVGHSAQFTTKNFEKFIRCLAYWDKNICDNDFFYKAINKKFSFVADGEWLSISQMWEQVRDILFGVFPRAIETAVKMSKELVEKTGLSEYDLSND